MHCTLNNLVLFEREITEPPQSSVRIVYGAVRTGGFHAISAAANILPTDLVLANGLGMEACQRYRENAKTGTLGSHCKWHDGDDDDDDDDGDDDDDDDADADDDDDDDDDEDDDDDDDDDDGDDEDDKNEDDDDEDDDDEDDDDEDDDDEDDDDDDDDDCGGGNAKEYTTRLKRLYDVGTSYITMVA